MKCTNCGFDAENNSVCPVCGYNLAGEAEAQTPPYDPAPQNFAQPQNPYAQPQNVQPQNPYAQPQNVQPQSPYAQPQNVQPHYNQPQAPRQYIQQPQQPAPAPNPGYNAQQPQPQPKPKKSRAGMIVLICVVGTVILFGIVLAILSSVLFDFGKNINSISGDGYDYYDEYYEFETTGTDIDLSKIVAHKTGESVDIYGCGTVTVKKPEKQTENAPLDKNRNRYALTIEFKNTRESEGSVPDMYPRFYNEEGKEIAYTDDPEVEYLYTDYDGEQYRPVESGKTATQVVYFDAKKELKKIYLGIDSYYDPDPENGGSYIYELNLE